MPEPLDRTLPIPLYYQLAQRLAAEIDASGRQPGEFFTTEDELLERFPVSRATVRRALEHLLNQGRLERITGKGTFIARPPLSIALPHLISFSEEIEALGRKAGTRVLAVEWVAPSPDARTALQLAGAPTIGSPPSVLRLTRLRTADEEVWVHMLDYLHPALGLTSEDDFAGSLYALLEARGGRVEEAVHRIRAVTVPDEMAPLLGVPAGSAALHFARTSYDPEGAPLIYEEAVCRGDRYTYAMQLKRKGGLR